MKKHKKQIQNFVSLTGALALFYVYVIVGTLEYGNITTGQAAGSCLIGVGYMTVAVITYKILGKED